MPTEALELLAAFQRAEYGLDETELDPIRIGEPTAIEFRCCWITAWNPLGKRRGTVANRRAQSELLAELAAARCTHLPGYARSPNTWPGEAWHEPCAVLCDPPDALIDRLAQRFRQLAVVIVHPGAAPRLRCYRRFWIERFGIADVDAPDVEWVA